MIKHIFLLPYYVAMANYIVDELLEEIAEYERETDSE